MTKKNLNELKKMFDQRHGISQRQLLINSTVRLHICATLRQKTNFRYYKKKKIPSRTVSQKARIKPLCRKLYRNFGNLEWVLDD